MSNSSALRGANSWNVWFYSNLEFLCPSVKFTCGPFSPPQELERSTLSVYNNNTHSYNIEQKILIGSNALTYRGFSKNLRCTLRSNMKIEKLVWRSQCNVCQVETLVDSAFLAIGQGQFQAALDRPVFFCSSYCSPPALFKRSHLTLKCAGS